MKPAGPSTALAALRSGGMTRDLHCACPITYDSILHAERYAFRLVERESLHAGNCDFHRDRTVDGDRLPLHFRSKSNWPGQGSIKGTAAGRPSFSGPASGGDARLCANSSRYGELSPPGL